MNHSSEISIAAGEQPVSAKTEHSALNEPRNLGFALPEAVLHSIPLPAEFEAMVRSAVEENRVKSVLPKFFNPLFRRQGVVNKHLIHALQSVGESLAHLAHEIETRDRILERLAAHLNAQGGQVQQNQLTLFQEAAGSRTRADSLLAGVRSAHKRLDEQGRSLDQVDAHVTEGQVALGQVKEQIATILRELADIRNDSDRKHGELSASLDGKLDQLVNQVASISARVTRLESQAGQQEGISVRLSQLETCVDGLKADIANEMQGARQEMTELRKDIVRETARIDQPMETLRTRQEVLLASLKAVSFEKEKTPGEIDRLQGLFVELLDALASFSQRQESLAASYGCIYSSVLPVLGRINERLDQSSATAETSNDAREEVEDASRAIMDGLYVALEARFRGPRDLIRRRQSRYLPEIRSAWSRIETLPPIDPAAREAASLADLPSERGVLDLGCGRGEWLELLKDEGVPALGVDQNRFFLQMCRDRGLNVAASDVLKFLRQAPDNSVAAITSFHVIEHLPIPLFQEMTRHVFRVLRRGGVAIFETPNPQNLLAGSVNFLLDPTHLRPVHPDFGRLVLETAGFASVKIDYMSPFDPSNYVGSADDPLAARFNHYFYGPQDFALIGVKP